MSDIKQDQLYQQIILEHNKRPRNYYQPQDFTHSAEGYNPLCGDHIWIYLKLTPDETLDEVCFQGEGCAICKSSASIMTTALKGKKKQEAEGVIDNFQRMIKGELSPEAAQPLLGKLSVFTGVWKFPARIKCASLAWHTITGALHHTQQVSTEENEDSVS
jgi:nitrogen fixation NifU-like protein